MPTMEEVVKEVTRCYQAFIHCNRQRMHVTKSLLNKERWELLHMVPTLMHINHHRCPGYIADLGDNVGVYGFKLNDSIRKFRNDIVHAHHKLSVGVSDKTLIESISTIGSAGTMAQTEASDFDFWIVAHNDVTSLQYKLLDKKCRAVIDWMMEQDPTLDTNFYMATPANVSRHFFGEVSDDSAGSALGKLLKEEYYRTCMLWHGKIPLWWCIPHRVTDPDEYYNWEKVFSESDLPFKDDIMDMGPIERSATSQFLGASLWQANKSLGSPFKSVLKLSVVNRYADDPDIDFIAERVRRQVQKNPTLGKVTDPYLALFDFCASYWAREGNTDVSRLMAEMYFLKVLNESDVAKNAHWDEVIFRRRTEIRDLLRAWGLTPALERKLRNMHSWSFLEVMKYNRRTCRFVNMVFDRVLLRLESLGLKIEKGKVSKSREDADDEALKILKQFENIAHKVQCFYGTDRPLVPPLAPKVRKLLHKSAFALVYNPSLPPHERWLVAEEIPGFLEDQKDAGLHGEEGAGEEGEGAEGAAPADEVVEEEEPPEPTDDYEAEETDQIYQCGSAMQAIAWLSANRLIKTKSVLRVLVSGQKRPSTEFRYLSRLMLDKFDHPLYWGLLDESEFDKPPAMVRTIVSFDLEVHSQLRVRRSKYEGRRSSQGGASFLKSLGYIHIAEQTNYGTIRTHVVDASKYKPVYLIARLLGHYGQWHIRDLYERAIFHSADTNFHQHTKTEFEHTYHQIHMFYLKEKVVQLQALRYVTKLLGAYVTVTRLPNGQFRASHHDTVASLVNYLERPIGIPVRTVVDQDAEGIERLFTLMKNWSPGSVSLFLKEGTDVTTVHVLDEAGNFYNHRIPPADAHAEVAAMMTMMQRMGGHACRFATNQDNAILFRPFDIYNAASEEANTYSYRVQPLKQYRNVRRRGLEGYLLARLAGAKPGQSGPTLEMILNGQLAKVPLKSPQPLAEAANHISSNIAHYGLKDFVLLEPDPIPNQKITFTTQHLQRRRALDVTLRKLMGRSRDMKDTQKVNAAVSTRGSVVLPEGATQRLVQVQEMDSATAESPS